MALIGASGSASPNGYATTFAQLLTAAGPNQPESSLVPVGQPTTFRSGAFLGNIVQIDVTAPGLPLDATSATCEAVAWDNSSGLYATWEQASAAWLAGVIAAGRAAPEQVLLISGGGTYTHDSFNLYFIPEPAAFTLAGLGVAALIVRRRKRRA